MIGAGAAFDFLAGTKRQAPFWMQRSGLEWLFRLCSEPRRLWERYLLIVPSFLTLTIGHLLAHALQMQPELSVAGPPAKPIPAEEEWRKAKGV